MYHMRERILLPDVGSIGIVWGLKYPLRTVSVKTYLYQQQQNSRCLVTGKSTIISGTIFNRIRKRENYVDGKRDRCITGRR